MSAAVPSRIVQGEAGVLRFALGFLHPTMNVRSEPYSINYLNWRFLTTLFPREEGSTWSLVRPGAPPSIEQIEQLQSKLRDGVRKILNGETWDLPTPHAAFVRRMTATPNWSAVAPRSTGAAPPPPAVYQWGWRMDDPESMALLGVASLIRHHGDRLRACAVCSAPFLAIKRQIYCGSTCTKTGQRRRPNTEA